MRGHALIGNCQGCGLVGEDGAIGWLCLPRPDSPPVFGSILDPEGGHFSIAGVPPARTAQRYLPNTAVVETVHEGEDGSRFEVLDFMPRFEQHGRIYRPLQLMRIVRPLAGMPQVTVSCRPVLGWSRQPAELQRGNSHVRWAGYPGQLRLTTDLPLTYLIEERPFTLTAPLHFVLSWDVPVEADLAETCTVFLHRTTDFWRTWVKRCSIPMLHQAEVIRSAITLKLHCWEETGAVLAAPTTSLPEIPGRERNWDYRFCWLRDAWFTVSALSRLGHLDDLEGMLGFLLDLAHRDGGDLHPVYRIDGSLPLPELEHAGWAGSEGSQPVRSGNQAAEHVQNDVYGEMLLALSTLYRDERFAHRRDGRWADLLALLARRCHATLGQADAGLWELRGGWKPHAFSALLSWAGLRAYERLVAGGRLPGEAAVWSGMRAEAEAELQRSVQGGVLCNAPGEAVADASLALVAILQHPDRELCRRTLAAIRSQLSFRIDGVDSGFFFRYRQADDFGQPEHAFVICSFWVAEALARLGEVEEGGRILRQALAAANHVGLLPEHFDPRSGRRHGNFPQCYSHVGLIAAACAVSPDSPLIG